jgi:hypothetical protein
MKDEEAIDWREGFQDFHWTRRTSSRSGDGRLTKEDLMWFLGKKGGGRMCERKN